MSADAFWNKQEQDGEYKQPSKGATMLELLANMAPISWVQVLKTRRGVANLQTILGRLSVAHLSLPNVPEVTKLDEDATLEMVLGATCLTGLGNVGADAGGNLELARTLIRHVRKSLMCQLPKKEDEDKKAAILHYAVDTMWAAFFLCRSKASVFSPEAKAVLVEWVAVLTDTQTSPFFEDEDAWHGFLVAIQDREFRLFRHVLQVVGADKKFVKLCCEDL